MQTRGLLYITMISNIYQIGNNCTDILRYHRVLTSFSRERHRHGAWLELSHQTCSMTVESSTLPTAETWMADPVEQVLLMPAPPHSKSNALTAAIDFTGGTLGGISTVLVGQPLDTVKVKLQTFPHLYKNALNCFIKTFKTEGVRHGLYRGTLPSLAANIAENSILFCAYGMCQSGIAKVAGKEVEKLSTWQNASAGFCAAFFSSLALCPTELIKCKLQTLNEVAAEGQAAVIKKNISPFQLTREIIQSDGMRGMFKGLTPTLAREMPGYFCFFGGYELTKSLLSEPGQSKDQLGFMKTVIAGGTGGCCFWISVFPADVIKSRIQTLPNGSSISFMDMFRSIVRNEGVRALYSGIGPSILRSFPATAALFVTYEYSKSFLTKALVSPSASR